MKQIMSKSYLQSGLVKKLPLTVIAVITVICSYAATITSKTPGGAWDIPATWTGNAVPAAGDDVIISAGSSVSVSAAQTCNSLTVNGNLSLTNTGITLTINNNSPLILGPGSNVLIGSGNKVYFSNTGGGSGITNNGGTIASTSNGADGGTIEVNISGGGTFEVNGSSATTINNLLFRQNASFYISGPGLLINGTLTIPNNNWNWNNASKSPIYGPNSTVYINNSGLAPSSNNILTKAWSSQTGTIGVTAGYPNNVTLVNLGTSGGNPNVPPIINVGWAPSGPVGLNGTLRLGDGTNPVLVSLHSVTSFNGGGIVVDNGSTLIGPAAGVTYINRGNFILQGSATGLYYPYGATGGATMDFAGSGTKATPQIISTTGPSGFTFANIIVSNGTYVRLDDDVAIPASGVLTFGTGGGRIGTSTTNTLTLANTATTAIAGGGAAGYIDGPLIWSLSASAANYLFPLGSDAAYLPLTLNKTAGAAVNATIQAYNTASGGNVDGTMSALSSEYWSLSTSAALSAASTVSASRPTAIAPFAYIAESKTTATGTYTSIGGQAIGTSINNSADIGTGSTFFFTFGTPPIISTLAPTSVTTTTATLQGAFNTGDVSKMTSFKFGTSTAYGTVLNTLNTPIKSKTSQLDSQFVTGLTANTEYHYMAQATDGSVFETGSNVRLTTAPNPPVVGIPNTATANGFTATWSAPAAMGPAAYTYTVEVSTSPAFSTGVITIPNISSSSTSAVITGLTSATRYYYRVKAVNETASSVASAASRAVSTKIMPDVAGCNAGSGSIDDPGAIAKTFLLPKVDGKYDTNDNGAWDVLGPKYVSNVSVGNGLNTTTAWKALWTLDTLYFLVQVVDGSLVAQNPALMYSSNTVNPGVTRGTSNNYYDFDGVEITLDADYSHENTYDSYNDVQFRFNLGTTAPSGQSIGAATPQFTGTMFTNVFQKINYRMEVTSTGYTLEVAIPWGKNTLNPGINLKKDLTYGMPSVYQELGVQIQVNDALTTNLSTRSAQYSWANTSNAPYMNPSQFAKAQLIECKNPPVVILPTVTNITDTSAVLGAKVTAAGTGGTIIARGTGYTASPDKSATSNALPEGGTSLNVPYSGPAHTTLTPQTKYYYLGYAINGNKETGVSVIDSFYTLSALPKVQPKVTSDPCPLMKLNWTGPAFPPLSEATKTGYLVLRAQGINFPQTTGIKNRVATIATDVTDPNTTLVGKVDGADHSFTDSTALANTVYNYILVPYTWNGVAKDSTYHYFMDNPSGVSAQIGVIAPPLASVTQQPACDVPSGTITIDPWDNTLTYSADGVNFVTGPLITGLTPNTIYGIVTKSSSGACTSLPTPVTIAPLPPCEEFMIPTLFTPNGDGLNDAFKIKGLPSGSELSVYNRWGDKVYENKNYDNLWNGNNSSDGVYYYGLKLPNGTKHSGWVQVTR